MTEENIIKIQQLLQELLMAMDFEGQVELGNDEQDFVRFNILTSEAKFLIGRDGENLKAMQQIGRALVGKKIGEPVRFTIDVNNYQKSRLDLLRKTARNLAYEVVQQGLVRWLPPLSAYERRIVHIELADFAGVKTESEGEGEEKRVAIRPVNN